MEAIAPNLWTAEQPLKYFGLPIRTRMTVIRLQNHELAIISPINIDDSDAQQLDELGKVSHIIAPNLYHYLFAADFKQRYPNAAFWATSGLKERKPHLSIDNTIGEDKLPFSDEVKPIFLEGFRTLVPTGFESLNEWVFLHVATRTLIITDAAFNFDKTFSLPVQILAKTNGIYNKLGPSVLEKVAIKEKAALKRSIQQILNWDFDRVVMAHGSVIEKGGKRAFERAYQFIL